MELSRNAGNRIARDRRRSRRLHLLNLSRQPIVTPSLAPRPPESDAFLREIAGLPKRHLASQEQSPRHHNPKRQRGPIDVITYIPADR
jgi:hypothetical protein